MRFERKKLKMAKSILAVDAKDVFGMETSIKEIDKAYRALVDATMILRKFEAALEAKKIKGKVDEATNIAIESLIEQVDKAADKVVSYSIKLNMLKEQK